MTSAEAGAAVVWTVEQVAGLLGVDVDPVQVRQEVRAALGSGTSFSPDMLLAPLQHATASVRLTPTVVSVSARELFSQPAPLPLVAYATRESPVATLILVERVGDRYRALKHGADDETLLLDRSGLERLVGDAAVNWMTAVPSTPLAALESAPALDDGHGHAHGHQHATPLQRVVSLIRLERDDIGVIILYAAVAGLSSLALPIAVQTLVTTVAFGQLLQPIVVLSFLLLLAMSFDATLQALQQRVVETVQQRIFARTSLDLAWRLPRVRREEAEFNFGPRMVNQFFDVITIQKAAGTLLTDGLATALQLVTSLVLLALYHPLLLGLDILLILAALAIVLIPARQGLKTSILESKAKYAVAAWLQELSRAPKAFRGTAGAAWALERADALTQKYLVERTGHFNILFGQTAAALALQVVTAVVLLGVGGTLVMQEQLTLGQLVAAELVVFNVTKNLAKTGKLLDSTYDLLTGLDKVGHLIDLPLESNDSAEPALGAGPMPVKAVSATDGRRELTLEVKPGARVALVGGRGSEIGEWLGGLRAPHAGSVELDGVDTRRARLTSLRDEVAYLRTDDIFPGTLLENVSQGRAGVGAREVKQALEAVSLSSDLHTLPQGMSTELRIDGAPLAREQVLKLLVARVLVQRPRLVVVDADVSMLPPEPRARVLELLTGPHAPWTLVALVDDPASPLAQACTELHRVHVLTPAEVQAHTHIDSHAHEVTS